MSKPQKSLKAQNRPLIVGAACVHAVIFLWLTAPVEMIAFDTTKWQELAGHVIAPGMMALTIPIVVTLVVQGALPSGLRDRVVHWRRHHPLPGSRAFTVYGPNDPRVSMDKLEERYGPLPEDPRKQDELFYSIYKEVQDRPGVQDAHKSYLALRDISSMTIIFTALLPIGAYVLTEVVSLAVLYFFGLVAAYVILSWAAKMYAARMVENALAAAS